MAQLSQGDGILGINSALKVELVTFISTQRKKNSLVLILISGHHR